MKPLHELPAFIAEDELRVVIETPRGSRNKYALDEEIGAFELKGVLPEGMSFPYDFGMIPSTTGKDGDPQDILVIMDAPAFVGCIIGVRLIGAIEADQREGDEWSGNDRLIGVATRSRAYQDVRSLDDLRPSLVREIEAFFEQYNRLAGKEFRPKRRLDPAGARKLVDEAMAAFRTQAK